MYRAAGPEAFRTVGETEFCNGIAAMSASGLYGPTRVCAGIVGCVDFTLGDRVRPVLENHIAAGNGRFKGIRITAAWDEFEGLRNYRAHPPGLLRDPDFRKGFAHLAPLGLNFETWIYFTQLDDLENLAGAFPETVIVVNHLGGPVGIGPYAENRADVLAVWKRRMAALSRRPNVFVKAGGLGMPTIGLDFERGRNPTSEEMAPAWRPYIETCLELFGAERCMFESNYPPDGKSCDYGVLWNVFKRIAAGYSDDEKEALFRGTAARVYRLAEP
jgi:predicted TIM-barrel fold metal-dependent hydrolase